MGEKENRQGQGACPSRAELAAFNLGKLMTERREAVAAHIEGCTRCLAVLEELKVGCHG